MQLDKKRRAAHAALPYLEEGMILGVGTGSTVDEFIEALKGLRIRLAGAVSSSVRTSRKLRAIGIEDIDLNSAGDLPLYVDGADQATVDGVLIKGGGGALTREKVVAAAAKRFVCIVDDSKMTRQLGAYPLPVEVIPMARSYAARELMRLGGQPVWREGVITDNGNAILDVHNLRLDDPAAFESAANQIAGIVTVGLFAARGADVLIIAEESGTRIVNCVDSGPV